MHIEELLWCLYRIDTHSASVCFPVRDQSISDKTTQLFTIVVMNRSDTGATRRKSTCQVNQSENENKV